MHITEGRSKLEPDPGLGIYFEMTTGQTTNPMTAESKTDAVSAAVPTSEGVPAPKPPQTKAFKTLAGKSRIKTFLELNPNLERIKAERDAKGGILKWVDVAIFGFLLFSPALPLIPDMESPSVVVSLWLLILLIMWCKIDYGNFGEVWYILLCRGIILDFPKTDSLRGWICQTPTYFALAFMFLFGGVTYLGLDPHLDFDSWNNAETSVLSVVGLSFVLLLTKDYVDIEGANQLLSLNLVSTYFQDPEFLKQKGFTVVHVTQLQNFVLEHQRLVPNISLADIRANARRLSKLHKRLTGSANENEEEKAPRIERKTSLFEFSWDQVHALSHEEDPGVKLSLIGGTRLLKFFKPLRDLDA
jgi:hypothetical protein